MTHENGFAGQPEEHLASAPASTGLLTAKASALAGFTLAVLSMLGQGSWTTAVQSFLGANFAPSDYSTAVLVSGVAALALAGGAMLLARRAMGAAGGGDWEDHVSRAALLVGGLGAVLAVATIVGSLFSRVT